MVADPVLSTTRRLNAPKDGPPKKRGRKKGIPNRHTMIAKDMVALAAEGIGGLDRLMEWITRNEINERIFWGTIYPKLIPLQVTGEGGGPIEHRIVKDADDFADRILNLTAQVVETDERSDEFDGTDDESVGG